MLVAKVKVPDSSQTIAVTLRMESEEETEGDLAIRALLHLHPEMQDNIILVKRIADVSIAEAPMLAD